MSGGFVHNDSKRGFVPAVLSQVDSLKGLVMRNLFRLPCSFVIGVVLLAGETASWAQDIIPTADDTTSKIRLFNGKNLDGWTHYLGKSDLAIGDVWSAGDGVLRCKGKPTGYLVTKRREFENYILELEWRWPAKPGNNGVLVHVTEKNALGVWPKSLEIQLGHGDAGDFWVIGTEIHIENVAERRQGRRHLNLTDDSEKPVGQWNHMRIVCQADTCEVHVNGELVNACSQISQHRGAIALQSEGAPIEYRNIVLQQLPR